MTTNNTLSAAELRVIELDREKAAHSKFYENYDAAIQALADEKGVGHSFQDEEGIVYRVHVPQGTFVSFRSVGIERTRRQGEAKGSLSMKAAQELGFDPADNKPEKSSEAAA